MKKIFGWAAIIVLLIGVATAFYFWRQSSMTKPQPLEPVEAPSPPSAQTEPSIHYPIQSNEDMQAAQPLPALNESDPVVQDEFSSFFGQKWFRDLFRTQEIVRNIVVTIDNLPRKTAAVRLFPVKPVGGKFLTTSNGGGIAIAAENAKRYTPYVRIAERADAKKLVSIYVHFYPLFQRAYQELGYPNGYFNDRLVAVIDHLLAAPEVDGPVSLVQPHVLYQFADPALEEASSGNKIMLRMGVENAQKIKRKLREIRRELTSQKLEK